MDRKWEMPFRARHCRVGSLLFGTVFLATTAFGADSPQPVNSVDFFEQKIRPLLADNCLGCHGPAKQRGGLRLDSRDAILSGGDTGAAAIPGKPDESRLIQAVRYSGELRMPPKHKLSDAHIADLSTWIRMRLPWPAATKPARPSGPAEPAITDRDRDFWSFRPVRQPPVPEVRDKSWPASPLDRFVLARQEEKGLHPVPRAEKRRLIRRATFDLIGLPPTPAETAAFLADESPDAFARLVDRLLASGHFGERWARHWLDVVRYGEDQAHTFQARMYPDGFRYRDWVIQSFNADKPYDRFISEQIAGDLLEGRDQPGRFAALGFMALGPVYYGKAVFDELDDRIDTLTRGLLGLTVACARCHDHKFDPISTRDYYALAGVFASTEYKEYVLTNAGGIDAAATSDPTDAMSRDKKKGPRRPVIHALAEGKPRNMRIHLRGNPEALGDEVPRRFLAILAQTNAPPFTSGSGRLELARSIANRDNPLTARVMVNRIWHHLFGRGIVGTPGNFGLLGEPPTNPELLDYLSSRFMANGWSIKSMLREILLSSTYQLGSDFDESNAQADPDNRYHWRMNRKRLEVEPWRDGMLAVAGNLKRTIGGPSMDLAATSNPRRTLYGAVSRHNLDPLLRLFDFPDPNLTSDRRPTTSVPLQQLFVLNSEFMARQAKALAARVTVAEKDNASRIRHAYVLAYGRPPSAAELRLGLTFLKAGSSDVWEIYAQALLSANEFAFVD